ncbi:uncharacterized protein LOC142979754 [Anticarsia gemmatalis]|uniref:uncharacterized protein LOC142979754 n=1 Tax=Anticarsia gemmatalis TaxID=129554 RepID=UPI003F76AF49
MAITGCSSGLVVTAAVALLLLPAQYYVPDLYSTLEDPLANPPQPETSATRAWYDLTFPHLPPLDLFVTVTLLIIGSLTYICEWIQRKLLERRIVKLNQYLGASVERLRAWDAQREQQETTLKMVQNATSEYNLLLYLLLRQHRCLASHVPPASTCFLDNSDELHFLRNASVDA